MGILIFIFLSNGINWSFSIYEIYLFRLNIRSEREYKQMYMSSGTFLHGIKLIRTLTEPLWTKQVFMEHY